MNYHIKRPNEENNTYNLEQPSNQWAERTLRDVLMAAYQEQRRARIWRNIWRGIYVLIFMSIIGITFNKEEKTDPYFSAKSKEHTALIELTGTIGGDPYVDQVELLRKGMEKAYKNENVKAILIRANSPGGSPVVSNTAFNEIIHLKQEYPDIPVYLVAEDVCASGCYYIAAAADKIFADPSSIIGSIGVISGGFDATELIQKIGVKRRLHIAGNNKGMGDPFSPETPEQAAIWQQMLDQIHDEFIQAVRSGRGNRLHEQENPDLFSGRVYTGIEAKKVGLIDNFGSIYSVARDEVGAPEIVDYTPTDDNFMSLLNRRLGVSISNTIKESLNNLW